MAAFQVLEGGVTSVSVASFLHELLGQLRLSLGDKLVVLFMDNASIHNTQLVA